MSCDKLNLSLKPNWSVASYLQDILLDYLHCNTCMPKTHIYYVNSVARWLIYFCRSAHTSFRLLCVSMNFLVWIFWFQKISNEVILWSTSEEHICFMIVTSITLIIWVAWISGLFLTTLILYLIVKVFFSLGQSSTVTAPWLIKSCPLCFSYWILQIQFIYLQFKYR